MAFQRTLETLRSNDADGNEKVKIYIYIYRFNKQNNNFALFCTFLSRFCSMLFDTLSVTVIQTNTLSALIANIFKAKKEVLFL